ncbi:hypothetical protein PUW24_02120 [Paenibacillus urinalis]|uniref:DUF2178 domain-containing protein n=1 Tax=Paenibacillus urinalis TaxID=521520 RepID=A0AAX3MWY5_9BACL|nr:MULTISPECIES: hypothetical protein [Paenibacillus]WDH81767.1 hypothetical protein PUW23_19975 [Paenibacillus urinalis]WDH97817.1 hypothetical protein PUW24_02120 [Paenibacillus urinalis]WDI01493.1 hypothetical protein PUW25_19855 [Paenibacillus urinalis]GAK42277.1 hypothetical protein TCA2_4769 [Paenibacillus sp. TCA20]
MSKKTISMVLYIVGIGIFLIRTFVHEADRLLSLDFVLLTLFTAGAGIYMIWQEKHELLGSVTDEKLLKMRKQYLFGLFGIGFVILLQVDMLFNELNPRPKINGIPRPVDWSSVQIKVFTTILFTVIWARYILGYFTLRNKKAENT